MRHEVEKRTMEYYANVTILSRDEAERFANLLKDIMKSPDVDGKFSWIKTDDGDFADVSFTFRARVQKDRDITPDTLTDTTDTKLYVAVNNIALINNEFVKVCKC